MLASSLTILFRSQRIGLRIGWWYSAAPISAS